MWYTTKNIRSSVVVSQIPVVPYARFYSKICELMGYEDFHIASYFGVSVESGLRLYCIVMDDKRGDVMITSWDHNYYSEEVFPSITAIYHAFHPFEREISENFGIEFKGNPYNKPLRFAHNRADNSKSINNYPFYTMDSHLLHQVNVGPIHAGIIEPGAFRFICNGEKVLHLEVVLGYQHRGVENLMIDTTNRLRQVTLAESVAGDSAVSNAVSMCQVFEGFNQYANPQLDRERAIALELERIAMHIADTGALCTDVGYQLGQVACEALRTIVINTTQQWCGNRFGKSLIRPFGTNFPLNEGKIAIISDNIKEVKRRFAEVCEDIFNTASVLSRFEDCGTLSRPIMVNIGAVGVAARASGLKRDIRESHKYGAYANIIDHSPKVLESGDVLARATMRYKEVLQSAEYIETLLGGISDNGLPAPNYDFSLPADSLSFSLIEGWRGEICHVAITDCKGRLACYKIKDPSLHNWYALSLSVRGAGISDFPVCNKSFNLSYCGHDL